MSIKRWKADVAEPLRFELGRRIKQPSLIVLWAVDSSALPPIADIRQCRWDVRFVPAGDIAATSGSPVALGIKSVSVATQGSTIWPLYVPPERVSVTFS